jgi:hypothetical protein
VVTKPSTREELTVLYHRVYDIITSVLTVPAPEMEQDCATGPEADMEPEEPSAPAFC